jgi:hypothetical protein
MELLALRIARDRASASTEAIVLVHAGIASNADVLKDALLGLDVLAEAVTVLDEASGPLTSYLTH